MKCLIALMLVVVLILTSLTVFAEEKDVESIKISVSSTVMEIGETQKIVVYVTPVNLNPTFGVVNS